MIFPELSNLGLDISYDGFWESHLTDVYGEKIQNIVEKACIDFNIKNTNLTDTGLNYLLQKTHLLRYVNSSNEVEPTNLFEFITTILFALFISGEYNEIEIDKNIIKKNFYVLDGTNLCFNFSDKHEKSIIFNPNKKMISCGLNSTLMISNGQNYLFKTTSQNFFNTLLYDTETEFIFFYLENHADEKSYDRFLLESTEEIKQEIETLQKCKKEILLINPFIWNCILRHITYINFTVLDGFESSTDPRELRNSIIINMRFDKYMDELETIAWVANGLYHEAKHNQYVDSVFFEIPPYETKQEYKTIFEKEEKTVVAPWKGLPQNRTLTQILLGLHAFVPGLFICFKILAKDKGKPLSNWIKNRIEMEMRSTNGTVSIIILSESYLTNDGYKFSNKLIDDFFDYLSPAYNELVDCRKGIRNK